MLREARARSSLGAPRTNLKLIAGLLTAMLSTGLTISAAAQEVLPFPPKPSGSTAGRTMQESAYSPLPR